MQQDKKVLRSFLEIHHLKRRAQKRRQTVGVSITNQKPVIPSVTKQPAKYSLENNITFQAYDQGDLGSCTANAFCAAFRMRSQIQNKYKGFIPSRLFFYYNERVMEGTVTEDAGADVVDGEEYCKQYGICSEQSWPYVESKFAVAPPSTCYSQARQYRIAKYQTLLQQGSALVQAMKAQLVANEPLLIAIAIFDSFESDSVAMTGMVPMPDQNAEELLGGHELCVVGYDDAKQRFLVLNSWGTGWGQKGKCWIPYAYFADPNLCYEVTWFSL